MSLKTIFTTALILSTLMLSACSNTSVENDHPNATSEVTIAVNAVDPESAEKPAFSASISVRETSTVIAIDHKTRVVTLKDLEGNAVTFTAGEEVRNLAQVNTGDTITAEYVKNFTLHVLEAKNPEAASNEMLLLGLAEEGDIPGMVIVDTKVEVLTVEEINLEASTFKLKNANNEVIELTAHNPENLKKAAVGDVVVITYTEGMAISVEEKPTN